MPGVLLDLRTGDPILENGDYVEIEDDEAFFQIITNLFYCQTGSEILNILYGFDLQTAIIMNSRGMGEQIIESLVAQALDPNLEPLIYLVEHLKAERDGQNMNVVFRIQSNLGTSLSLTQTIGE